MARFDIDGATLELPRNLALLDTNVLAAFVNETDPLHQHTRAFMELVQDFVWLVAPPVIVEACGLLSRRRHDQLPTRLIQWVLTPGNALVLPSPHSPLRVDEVLSAHSGWMARHRVDFVDAYLMEVAHLLTERCALSPYAPIVTFDTGDFTRCAAQGFRYSLYDVQALELVEFR